MASFAAPATRALASGGTGPGRRYQRAAAEPGFVDGKEQKMKSAAHGLAIAVLASVLAGCTSGSRTDHPEWAGHPASVKTSPAPAGAISDLSKLHCVPKHRVWNARGTLVNRDKVTRTYRLQVAVVDPATSSVLGERDKTIKVSPGESAKVHLTKIYRGGPRATCVPRVTLLG